MSMTVSEAMTAVLGDMIRLREMTMKKPSPVDTVVIVSETLIMVSSGNKVNIMTWIL